MAHQEHGTQVSGEQLALESRAPAQRCWEMADLRVSTTANNRPSHVSPYVFQIVLCLGQNGRKWLSVCEAIRQGKKEKETPRVGVDLQWFVSA